VTAAVNGRVPPVVRSWRSWGPLLAGALVMAYGLNLRAGTFTYGGPHNPVAFNGFASAHLGAYSDIASLYFKNHMWHGLTPYWHYSFEYPVGTGLLAYLTSLLGGGVGVYLAVNAAVLIACGLLTIWLLRRWPGANPWLLALSPALALYVVLNWDLLSIAALVLALVLFDRRRDGWSGAALAVATWTKFFPVIALPVLLWIRLLDEPRDRARSAARILVPFGLVTAAMNVPFLFDSLSRHGWAFFFQFNTIRRGTGSVWQLISHGHIAASTENLVSLVLLAAGIAAVLAAVGIAHRRHGVPTPGLIAPALLASFGWLFLTTKLYNPQYDLWVMVLIACAAVPPALAVAFAAADLAFFTATFTQFRLGNHWIEVHVARLSIVLREAALLAVVGWAVWQIVGPWLRRRPPLPAVQAEALTALTGAPE
jgi:uncharacterized membrane protein